MSPIKDVRDALGWSQDQLGLAIGVHGSRISRLERGLDSLRTVEAEAVAKLGGWTVGRLIEAHESFRRARQASLLEEARVRCAEHDR